MWTFLKIAATYFVVIGLGYLCWRLHAKTERTQHELDDEERNEP